MCMRITHCLKCNNYIPTTININGKIRNLQKRKYCLECSPFDNHNTSKLHIPDEQKTRSSRDYSLFSLEEKKKFYDYQREKRYERKKYLVETHGGKCSECNYDRNLAALCFHHINPEEKSFTLDVRNMYAKSLESLEEESKKCVLLCSNCHTELHYPQANDWN
jgi:hypothetical protein